MKIYLALLSALFFYCSAFSQEVNDYNFEPKISKENPNISQKYWKNIYSIKKNLSIVNNRINTLKFIFEGKIKSPHNKTVDEIEFKLVHAKDHLQLGNPAAALLETNHILLNNNINDPRLAAYAYKIIFESRRMLGDFKESTNVCIKMLPLAYSQPQYFDDKWKMLCSYSFLKSSQLEQSDALKNNLTVWSLSPQIRENAPNSIKSAMLIALAFREQDNNNKHAIVYLNSAIAHAKEQDPNLGQAYLALALLYFGDKNHDESFSILYDLAVNHALKKSNYRLFQVDDSTQWLARLSLARLYVYFRHNSSAQTWYEDVLSQNKAAPSAFFASEKNKILFEYARVLHRQKKYSQSEMVLKKIIEDNDPTNMMFGPFNIKISKIMLADILNQTQTTMPKGESVLRSLYDLAQQDKDFLKNQTPIDKLAPVNGRQRFVAVAALAQEYGLSGVSAKKVLKKYITIEKMNDDLPDTKANFVNALNTFDLREKGIYDQNVIADFKQVENNFTSLKDAYTTLNETLNHFYGNKYKVSPLDKDTIKQNLSMLEAADDDLSLLLEKEKETHTIFKNDLLISLKDSYRSLNHLKARLASLNFITGQGLAAKDSQSFTDQELRISNALLTYRKSIIENELYTRSFYSLNKKYDVMNLAIKNGFSIYKETKKNMSTLELEQLDVVDDCWEKLTNLNKQNNNLLNIFLARLGSNRKLLQEEVEIIDKNILAQEDTIKNMQSENYEVAKGVFKSVERDLIERISDYQDYVKLSLASLSKNKIDLQRQDLEEEMKVRQRRQRYIFTLQKSIDWELVR